MSIKRIIFCFALLSVFSIVSCGKINESSPDETPPLQGVSDSADNTDNESSVSGENSSADENIRRPAGSDIGDNGAKAVVQVMFYPEENIDASRMVSFTDMYARHVLHTGVVGRVGAPVEVDYDTKLIQNGLLYFKYDPDKLEGVRPDSLGFLWYDEENGTYTEMFDVRLNKEKCTVCTSIDKPGVYVLVNKYAWLNVWGADLNDDGMEEGYDPLDAGYSSEAWSAEEYTGDIIELADMEYIKHCVNENNCRFEVSSPEELASAVYYVNCCPSGNCQIDGLEIILTDDIDLEGLNWAGMGWSAAGLDNRFMGIFDGQGHTVRNMRAENPGGNAGFISESYYSAVRDVNFENAYVSGWKSGILFADDNGSEAYNCYCSGEVTGTQAGALGGGSSSRTEYINCSADVLVNGEDKGDILSCGEEALKIITERNPAAEEIWLDDGFVICREAGLEDIYRNLGWNVQLNGAELLERNAENETAFHITDYYTMSGHYSVTLTAFVEGYYIPISNTVEFDMQ